ncbi:prolyl oligopeptidase [Catenaria anguillulae PL171]|uniref:Prolyl endopeptidase n=1 Tax=Catenaria anguillulae PL171 TaxID=765915 RepID=A0A1Y2I470_9FUNG|nr:prolyl oligopeptidase [Catenaria anguillulae PL171]
MAIITYVFVGLSINAGNPHSFSLGSLALTQPPALFFMCKVNKSKAVPLERLVFSCLLLLIVLICATSTATATATATNQHHSATAAAHAQRPHSTTCAALRQHHQSPTITLQRSLLFSVPTCPNPLYPFAAMHNYYTWPKYPDVPRDNAVSESLHGHTVADPYRWLEDPDSDATKRFVDDQANLAEAYLAQYPHKKQLEDKLTSFWDYERFSAPSKEGEYYYFWTNPGLVNQAMLYRQRSLDSEPELFFDPNTLSADGTIALSTYSFSENATYFAYALSKSGSDWVSIHVMQFAKFTSINWTKDERGFFYSRYPRVEKSDLLGTSQADDILVYHDPEHPKYRGQVKSSDCGNYLILGVSASTARKNLLWIAPHPSNGDLSFSSLAWNKLVNDIDLGSFLYLTNEGPLFYFRSNWNAPKQRIIKYDLTHPELGFVDVIAQDPQATLTLASVVDGNKLMLVYMHNVKDTVYLHDLATGARMRTIELPTVASVGSLSGDKKYAEVFYSFSSFLSPGTIVRYDVRTGQSSIFKQSKVKGFDADQYEAKQVFYPSRDGTRVPMFIMHRRGIAMDGSNPALLYGYGGFSISLSPGFSPSAACFMQAYDAVYAVANLRGGGEFGEDWHHDGMLHKKQNVFDDFQWAAQYLVQEGYTSHNRLAINGGSNGGLLVAACINQAPHLFGAAVGEVGVLDMLRFHKFTIGHAWTADYGNPEVAADFEYLLGYSPLHNVKKQVYPATLLMTSDHDDRVVPLHSYKYAAQLQHVNPDNEHPLLLHVERKAGHGAGKPTKKRIESAANKYAFIAMNTGAEWVDRT